MIGGQPIRTSTRAAPAPRTIPTISFRVVPRTIESSRSTTRRSLNRPGTGWSLTRTSSSRRFWSGRMNVRSTNRFLISPSAYGMRDTSEYPRACGREESGTGITNSPHALAELTRTRFILEDRSRSKRELWWYPYTPVLRRLAFAMARARGGAGFFGRIAAFFQLLGALPKRLMGG